MIRKTFALMIISAFAFNSIIFASDWAVQANGLASSWQVVDVADTNFVIAYAHNVSTASPMILISSNGGESWKSISWSGMEIIDMTITDSLNFWLIDYKNIFHTSDGGKTWQLQYDGDSTTSFLNYIEMFDSLNGIAVGDALPGKPALILKTMDGGENWFSQNDSMFIDAFSLDSWRCMDFVSPDVGYCSFSYSGVPLNEIFMQKTADGGRTWQSLPISQKEIQMVRFYDENIGLCTYPDNRPVWRTLNGGTTWESFPIDSHNGWPNDIEFFPDDPAKVFAIFSSALFFSNDTGRTWREISTPDIGIFRDIVIADSNHAWIVGEDGIIHTSSGGFATSVKENRTSIPKNFALFQNYPNPFNSSTVIRFSLQAKDKVTLKIYNLVGEEVAVLANGKDFSAGNHVVRFNAGNLVSGIYLCRFTSSQGTAIQRLVLLR